MPRTHTKSDAVPALRRTVAAVMAPALIVSAQLLAACHTAEQPTATTSSTNASPESGGAALDTGIRRVVGAARAQAGVVSVDLGSDRDVAVDSDTRFPMLSTFKTYAVAAVLDRSAAAPQLLDETESVSATDIVTNSPVLQARVGTRISVRELCVAALQRSDNTAGNLLLRRLGGPGAITAFARRVGDTTTRLDRWEPDLNEAAPGDLRDTTTARGLAAGYRELLDGDFLPTAQRATLVQWLRDSTTSQARFRAQLPEGWSTADKTGSGAYQTTNDAGLLFGPSGQRTLLVVLTRGPEQNGPPLNGLVATIAATVAGAHW